MTNKVFNFNDYIVDITSDLLVGGKLNINNAVRNGGIGEGNDAITITYSGKSTKTAGADGSIQMNRTTDDSGELTMKFLNTSPVNNILIDFHEIVKNQTALFNVSMISRNNGRSYNYFGCQLESLPDESLGVEGQSWVWKVLFSTYAIVAI